MRVDLELLADPPREVARCDLSIVGFSGTRLLTFVDDPVSQLVALRIPATRWRLDVVEVDRRADDVFRQQTGQLVLERRTQDPSNLAGSRSRQTQSTLKRVFTSTSVTVQAAITDWSCRPDPRWCSAAW